MRLLDRLVWKEVVPPWLFGVGMFTSLLMAATVLGRLTGYVVDGVPGPLIAQIVGLTLPGIMAKTFPMAVLLAALLGFGRLSADSEITAVRAAGAGIGRVVRPVVLFSLAVAGLAFVFNETVVPRASRRVGEIVGEIARSKDVRVEVPIARTVVKDRKLQLGIVARRVNPLDSSLEGVTMVSYDDRGRESAVLLAPRVQYTDQSRWRVEGGGTVLLPDGSQVIRFQEAWPESVPSLTGSFADLVRERESDPDALSMGELRQRIERYRREGSRTEGDLANYEYWYWNKLSVPLAAVVFGTLGAVLGIRPQRTGTATGFALSVAIIFGYVTLANFMAVWAQGGTIPSWLASFAPLALGAVAALILLWRRDR